MANYTVFESTNMKSTKYAERILDAVADVDVENGTFGYLDGLVEGESVIYKFVSGIKEGEDIVVVDNPAWDADTCKITNQRKDNYINVAGTPFRVRVVAKRDEFAISAEGVTPATRENIDVNTYVTIDATTGKLVVSESKTDGATFEGQVMRKRNAGGTLVTAAHKYGYSRVMYEIKVTTI